MIVSYSTAKWLAPTCFLLDVAAQTYGILSTPNMKDINDRNLSFWSPHPFFIAVIFFSLQVVQVAWLYRLIRLDSQKPGERKDLDEMVDFVPYYCLANICLGVWMIFWNAELLKISDLFVIIYAVATAYYMLFGLQSMDTSSTTSILTNVVCRLFAGLGILDILHNTSIAYFKDAAPSIWVIAFTIVWFGGFAAIGDWIFGGCLTYDLLALAAGQHGGWRWILVAYAGVTASIVAAKNLARPPYNKDQNFYSATAADDIQDRV